MPVPPKLLHNPKLSAELWEPTCQTLHIGADLWEGDATKHVSVEKGVFSEKA